MKVAPLLLLLTLIFSPCFASAQMVESFDDGDFIHNPLWTGSSDSWMVNSGLQLQSSNTVAGSTFYLSTGSNLAATAQWEFSVRLGFNTSSANYADVFLTASASDLTGSSTTGYFVRIGTTDDEVSLYRKDAGGTVTRIIDGTDGITNTGDNQLKIKVVRDAGNRFLLFRNASGNGPFITEGSVVDDTYTTSSYFGFVVRQSTAGFFQKHFFNDIAVQPYQPDLAPPSVQTVVATSASSIDVLFTEPVDLITAQTPSNYFVNNNIGGPLSIQPDAANAALVHLAFGTGFRNSVANTLTVNGVQDIWGNAISNATATFTYYMLQRYDVVIDEIMADPSPPVGLPNAEYVELKNVCGRAVDIQGWRLATPSAASSTFPGYILPADSFIILTSNTNAAAFASYGKVLGIGGFPSLDNESATLSLLSKEGITIHSVSYSSEWYQNPVKKEGGWSLEMTDTHYPCSGQSNWTGSIRNEGGTPGKKNSADAMNKDETAPVLKRAFVADSTTIILMFDEPVDSTAGSDAAHYKISPDMMIGAASTLHPDFRQVQLTLLSPLLSSVIYTITASGITDCAGNEIGNKTKVLIGLPQEAGNSDLVINEFLFDPQPNTSDYVEFYNRSNKIIDAAKVYIANRNSSGAVASLKKISEKPLYIFPGDYCVVTEDASGLQKAYLVKNPEAVISLSGLPSFPDDKGNVVLLNNQGVVIDEVAYSKDWHFALITNAEGVSLERMDPDGKSGDKNNWHSAASTAGFGTPTYRNSQYKQSGITNATLEINPKVFSPDNDGHDDVATINYQVSESGYAANITIFDAAGRPVRRLVKNEVLGLKGSWNWNGLDEKGQKLSIGTYIIYTEMFNLRGKKERFKNTVVLAGKLN